jgi:hypothetical protein
VWNWKPTIMYDHPVGQETESRSRMLPLSRRSTAEASAPFRKSWHVHSLPVLQLGWTYNKPIPASCRDVNARFIDWRRRCWNSITSSDIRTISVSLAVVWNAFKFHQKSPPTTPRPYHYQRRRHRRPQSLLTAGSFSPKQANRGSSDNRRRSETH